MTKVCSRCKEEKPVSDFGKANSHKDGLRYECRTCTREVQRKYREKNLEKVLESERKYRRENREKFREWQRKYEEKNQEKLRDRGRKYREENREKIRQRKLKYHKENRDYKLSKDREDRRKKNEISASMATKSGRWSQEEVDLLVELRKTRTAYQCAIELGRKYGSTQAKIVSLRKEGVDI